MVESQAHGEFRLYRVSNELADYPQAMKSEGQGDCANNDGRTASVFGGRTASVFGDRTASVFDGRTASVFGA